MIFDFREQRTKILHLCWLAFFLCFFNWFSLAPLLPLIKKELHLSKTEVTLIVMAAVVATIPLRVIVGWAVDKFGGRRLYTFLLTAAFFPALAMAVADSFWALFVSRLFLGLIGASFVIGIQIIDCWFRGEEIGKAEGIYAGWGNAGSAGSAFLLPLVAAYFGWRWAFALSALLLIFYAPIFYRYVRDTPFGDIPELKKARVYNVKSVPTLSLLKNKTVLILMFGYACCFGVEITTVAFLPSYLYENFNLSLTTAGMIASLFGLMNIFARPGGGTLSDKLGRKKMFSLLLFLEGISFIAIPFMPSLIPAMCLIIIASIFTQASEGAEFSLVPFTIPNHTGKVAGYVGAGGNIGGLLFPIAFGFFGYQWGFRIMGLCAIGAAFLMKFVDLKKDADVQKEGIWGTGRVVMIPALSL